ncbi:ABC transporter ATP-binding protein [Ochrovirga pacifica]|uniref:ABC transporter ATP-binding protein n=1 Tax=Ochrovirga pacifica TaxID=1042376 RepID=UPI000255779B|nr:ABC transporter ATP-binding protein [Ochrovirga pacifica]
MNNFKRFVSYANPYKFTAFLGIFFNILYALFTTLSYVILMPTLDVLFGDTERVSTEPTYPGINNLSKDYLQDYLNYHVTYTNEVFGEERTLMYLIVTIISVFLLKNIFAYLGKITMAFLKNNVLKDLRNEIYSKIISLPIFFYSEKRKGDIIARATGDIGTVNSTYLDLVITYIREPLNIVFTLFVMFKVSWQLTLVMFGFIPLSGFIISLISKKIKQQSKEIFAKGGNLLGIIEETIGGLKIIKAFTSELFFDKKYRQETEEIRKLSNQMSARQSLASPVSEFLGVVSISSLLWFGGKMVLIDQVMTGGVFIGFMASAYNILTPAKTLSKANNAIKVANSAAERVIEVLDTENPLADQDNAKEIDRFNFEIEFKNISFKYDEQYVLKNFSLKIPKGKKVALVGQSGSGKSTLANLITRFWDVNEGEILIDGINIKELNSSSLRKLMGIVTQDSILFNDSIKNNIALGESTEDLDKIKEAAKTANAHDFIEDFPYKYDTAVGDRGGMLSGGQRQRVSIARAIYKNPPIMIFDEATSALDTESEKLVQDALEKLMTNRTSLVIAHRLSTIQNADTIVVLKKGKIVEQGTHEQLIAANGNYKKLVELQSLEG